MGDQWVCPDTSCGFHCMHWIDDGQCCFCEEKFVTCAHIDVEDWA